MIVMKFGGTSVGSAQRIREVARIVTDTARDQEVVVVTSAMSKVTDLLVAAAAHAASRSTSEMSQVLSELRAMHTQAAEDLGAPLEPINERLDQLEHILASVSALGETTPRAIDLIISHGERLSIHLLSAAIAAAGPLAEPVEANELIVTTAHYGDARPLLNETRQRTLRRLGPVMQSGAVPVVTGFIGATPEGFITTLGRGGSDYTATILGHALDAEAVWIWTDVDGVMTADPRIVPDARTIDALTFTEAAELSYFGAKVLHPLTIVPAALKGIPVFIKNTFNPTATGTKVSADDRPQVMQTISSMKNLALITVQGRGMIGVPGVAAKVFTAIAAERINVLFISQASSEYNISLVVHRADAASAVRVLRRAFATELADQDIEDVVSEDGVAIVAVVGEGMRGRPGVAGTTFAALGDAEVNILAIAQGSSERNISLVVDESDVALAVQAIHAQFYPANKVNQT
ncbi:MAG: aspartate kinase [Candidatus Saccharibacteria bacterium]|jgi:aspartate kinase|nr:aspartate kinase [Candidatus Saccharibacteria bacterium]